MLLGISRISLGHYTTQCTTYDGMTPYYFQPEKIIQVIIIVQPKEQYPTTPLMLDGNRKILIGCAGGGWI